MSEEFNVKMIIVTIALSLASVACMAVAVIFYVRKTALTERLRIKECLLEERDAELAARTDKLEKTAAELSALRLECVTLRERSQAAAEEGKKAALAAEEHFRILADDIFRAQSARFRESSEQRLGEMLNPLKTGLDEFRRSISDAVNAEARERFSLRRELQSLVDLNKSIGKEAQELARALKGDSKVQGDWGEMILERLLEMSGLQEGVHYLTQPTRNPDGSKILSPDGAPLRPDVVVLYPDDRCVVIDSKVSLSAYAEYVNAPDPSSPEAVAAGRRHLVSARSHIAELAQKRYQDLVGEKQLDFALMFIPNEGAFMALMHLEPGLWEEAFRKRVLITSPTHLMSVLRMLAQLWRQDASRRNVAEIARLSGTMIDKITGFLEDLDGVRNALEASMNAYTRARRRLAEGNGNVLVTARKIVALGAKTAKGARFDRLSSDAVIPAKEEDDQSLHLPDAGDC